ncbi:MAG: hypothetical protein KJ767_02475 [Nanoarchaeota archaeon]|nr:hypothetical protein [Nanoarchaeota archaeon]
MRCTECNKEIDETFMEKLKGTYIKGKPYCSNCQKKLLGKGSSKEK